MEVVKLLEERIGGRWTGIVFHRENGPNDDLAERPMSLCEAIKESNHRPIVLTQHLVNCPGAHRSFGWATKGDDNIARKIVEATRIKPDIARKLIANIPRFEEAIAEVLVGAVNSPDIVISYAQPEAGMRLVRRWQQVYGTDLHLETSSVMAVCGSVAVRAYTTDRICVSFGCPDSRKYGAIGRDRLVIGLPTHLAWDLF